MKLNTDKSKYMIVNFTKNHQFNTRLILENRPLQQVKEARLLGVMIFPGTQTPKHLAEKQTQE